VDAGPGRAGAGRLTTAQEAARRAALSVLSAALPDLEVLRNAPEPTMVEFPVLLLQDPEGAADAEERTLGGEGVALFSYADQLDLGLYAAARFAGERDGWVDSVVERLEAAVAAARTLGGAVDWAELSPPGKRLDRTLGAVPVLVVSHVLTLRYVTTSSSG
jgi:hypothetical protein